jgi:hypothetical protein
MPLQNRVDPFGDIHALPARGMFTGNRGVIHDPQTRTLLKRRWTTKAWLICVCEFDDRRRDVMGRNARGGGAGWTELFFLDEVTALSAGHRPCFFCRREKAVEYADCFGKAFDLAKPKVGDIDARLHSERLASGGSPGKAGDPEVLPDGAMVSDGEHAFARKDRTWIRWSWEGYSDDKPHDAKLSLVTPPATIAVLRAGYQPEWHSTA